MESRTAKNLIGREILFWFFFFLYSVLSFYLFYRQASTGEDGRFLSDMPSYIGGVLGTNARDPYPYRLFFWLISALNNIFPINLSAALGTVFLNSLNVFILRYFIDKYITKLEITVSIKASVDKRIDLTPYVSVLFLFSCLLSSMIIIPVDALYKFPGQYYIGQGSGNMWHNATYLATRPFSTLSFFLFAELLEEYEKKIDIKKLVFFALSLFLSVFTKPTFAFVMLPSAAVVLLARLILNKFKHFKNSFFLCLSFIPATADMLRQYLPVFGSSKESGIGFGPGIVWKQYTNSIFMSILLCFAFSVYILIFSLRERNRSKLLSFSWIFLFISLAEGVLLNEKGPRMPDGNFLQGYIHAMFYLFIVSGIFWLAGNSSVKRKGLYNLGAFVFFCAHSASGIWYFVRLLSGYSFY